MGENCTVSHDRLQDCSIQEASIIYQAINLELWRVVKTLLEHLLQMVLSQEYCLVPCGETSTFIFRCFRQLNHH